MVYAEKVPWSKLKVLGYPVWQWTMAGSLGLALAITPLWYSAWSEKFVAYHQPYPYQPKEIVETRDEVEDLGSYQRVRRHQHQYQASSPTNTTAIIGTIIGTTTCSTTATPAVNKGTARSTNTASMGSTAPLIA